MALTDVRVRQAKTRGASYKLSDERGLFLLVHPNGSKYWRLKYRVHGRNRKGEWGLIERTLALGVYPDISLAQARQARDKAKEQIKEGEDPVQAKRVAKRAAAIKAENSFEAIAREWHAKQAPLWTDDHAERVLHSLKTDVFPEIGSRPIAEITAPDILAVRRKVEAREALETAGRLRQRCQAVFRYAVQTGRAQTNPVVDLAGALKTRKVAHRPALTRQELPTFLQKLSTYEGHATTKLALRLMVLTFVHTGELRAARWNEFDEKRAEWRIPAARMKMRREHLVPLSTQALRVLKELRPITGHHDLLFPAQTGEGRPMSENTMLYAMYRMGYHGRATIHGIRATASTILNEMGWRPDVIERQLAHAEANQVRAAYHRSEYLEDRKKLMQEWADYVDATLIESVRPPATSTKIHRRD